MHRPIKYLAIGLLGALATSCGPEKAKSIDQMKNLTAADSLVYFYGQIRSHEYDKMAIRDTSYNSRAARLRYVEGLNKGFDLVDEDDNAYNQGLKDGIDLAIRNIKFSHDYQVQPSKKVLLQSMAYGILDNDTINPLNAQVNFYNNVHILTHRLAQDEMPEIKARLAQEAQIRDMEQISELLYKRVIEEGKGAPVEEGSVIDVHVRYSNHEGEALGLPSPRTLTVGSNMLESVKNIYLTMRQGEIASFLTSAYSLFGNATKSVNMMPDDLVIVSITIHSVTPPGQSGTPTLEPDTVD